MLARTVGESPAEERPVLRAGAVVLDRRRGDDGGGAAAPLTRIEFLLLAALLERAGEVLSRRVLAGAVWGEDLAAEGRPIDESLGRLRRKLRRAAAEAGVPAPIIEVVKGVGYRLVAPPAE